MSWLLVPAFLLAVAANAQLSRTTESIDVNVIEVDAVVLNAQGKPVPGLTRNDFELRVGGRRRPISNFYEVEGKKATNVSITPPNADKPMTTGTVAPSGNSTAPTPG